MSDEKSREYNVLRVEPRGDLGSTSSGRTEEMRAEKQLWVIKKDNRLESGLQA
jgi:hypothetical protein